MKCVARKTYFKSQSSLIPSLGKPASTSLELRQIVPVKESVIHVIFIHD